MTPFWTKLYSYIHTTQLQNLVESELRSCKFSIKCLRFCVGWNNYVRHGKARWRTFIFRSNCQQFIFNHSFKMKYFSSQLTKWRIVFFCLADKIVVRKSPLETSTNDNWAPDWARRNRLQGTLGHMPIALLPIDSGSVTIKVNLLLGEKSAGSWLVVMNPSRAGSSQSSSWRIFSSDWLGSWPFSLQLEINNWPKRAEILIF